MPAASTGPGSKPKRHYGIDPAKAHERAIIAARARNSPDTYIRLLERATLTDEQKRRLAALLVRLLIGEQPAAEAQR